MFAEQLLRASIEGGVVILVLFVGLKLVPSVPPLVRVWLWRLAFLKLAIGLLPIARIPLNILPQQPQLLEQQVVTAELSQVSPTQQKSLPTPSQWLFAWAAGVTVSGIFLLRRVLIARAVVSNADQADDDALRNKVNELSKRAGLTRLPNVLLNNARSTAVVVGGAKRSIVLPNDDLSEEDRSLILAHEIAHIAHRDLEWNALFSIVQVLFFFHPLVWFALRSAQNAQEAAADATAINLTRTSPKRYGEMLVRATVLNASPFPSLAAGLWLGASTGSIRGRIKDLRFVNTRLTAGRLASMITVICLVAAITPAYQLGARPVADPAVALASAPVALQTSHPHAMVAQKQTRTTKHRRTHRGHRSAPSALQVPVAAAPALAPVAASAPVSVTTRVAPQAVTVETSAPTTAVSMAPITAPAAVSVPLAPVDVTTAPAMRPVRVRTVTPPSAKISISAPATAVTASALAPAAPAAPQAKRARAAKRTRGAHNGTSKAVGYSVSSSPTAIATSNGYSVGSFAITATNSQGVGEAHAAGSSNGDTTTIVRSSTANAEGGQSVNVGVNVTSNKRGTGSYAVTARGQRTNIHQGHGVGKGVGHGVSTASSNGAQARGGN